MLTAQQWIDREVRYASQDYDGDGCGAWVVDRRSSLLITAPHAVNHHDPQGVPKVADLWTGGLTELLAESLGASAITATARVSPWTRWEERDDPFSRALAEVLSAGHCRLVVDVHGMRDSYGVDLCVGLGPGPGEVEQTLANAVSANLNELFVTRNQPFSARGAWTVTSRAHAVGVSGVQLEIARRYRDPVSSPRAAERVINALADALRPYS